MGNTVYCLPLVWIHQKVGDQVHHYNSLEYLTENHILPPYIHYKEH